MSIKKNVSDTADIVAQPVVNILSSLFLEGITSQFLPGVTTTLISYRQKRSENMVRRFLVEIENRHTEIEQRLATLEREYIEQFKEKYWPIIMDHIYDNKQEEKISIIVCGFISLLSEVEYDVNVVNNYFDVLANLNILDIRVLNELRNEHTINNTLDTDPNIIRSQTNAFIFLDMVEKTSIKKSDLSYILAKLEKSSLIDNTQFYEYEDLVAQVIKLTGDTRSQNTSRNNDISLGMPPYYILSGFGIEFINFFYLHEKNE
ncbi:hypothetical protein [Paenibacillus xylanexedens]|uniref:hypothetical protein n=1 Tax=Paenibacillus xylanexedens TaxID=528191 RepID=UPI0011A0F39E|nr:hypothetical protein [Paenibacillus xylanexedens]